MGASSVCLATLSALIASIRVGWAECKPSAVAKGDPDLVKGLESRLSASGISTTATAGCPSVRVDIQQRGPQVHLRLADAAQRIGERDVQDVATAAAIVESWTYQEIEAGTLPPEAIAAAPVVIAESPHTSRTGIAAAVVSSVGTNGGTTWIGGSISACVRLGAVCVGATLRPQLDTTATGDTTTVDQSSYSLGALATIDLPRRLGGLVLSPGVGIGYTFLHVVTHHHAGTMPLDLPTDDHQLRAGAHAAVLWPWGDHVAAFADAWVDAALARSDSQFGPTGAVTLSLGLRIEAR